MESMNNKIVKFEILKKMIIELDNTEWVGMKSQIATSIKCGQVKLPSTFTEKGICI